LWTDFAVREQQIDGGEPAVAVFVHSGFGETQPGFFVALVGDSIFVFGFSILDFEFRIGEYRALVGVAYRANNAIALNPYFLVNFRFGL